MATKTKSSLQKAFLTTTLLVATTIAATTVQGPPGPVSIGKQPEYSSIRPCAAGCLVYQGPYYCGVGGYNDLAIGLQCGCSPLNQCYCSKDNLAPASSYISSCVSAGCAKFLGEVTSAIAVYDGYCATANVPVSTTSATTSAVIGGSKVTSTSGGAATVAAKPTSGADTTPTAGSAVDTMASTTQNSRTSSTSDADKDKKGLSQSDIIALGVGLGVGVPSLLLALATFCISRKKRSNLAAGRGERLVGY